MQAGSVFKVFFIALLFLGCSHSPPKTQVKALEVAPETTSKKPSFQPPSTLDEDPAPSAAEEAGAISVDHQKNKIGSSVFPLDWPVYQAKLTRGFLPHKRGKPHLGLDLAAPKGSPILAAHSGTIIYAGREFRGYGKMIMIEGREGFATLYAHLAKIKVREGDRVLVGDEIGKMGRTGHATGSHLHFEVRTNQGPIDPLPLLPDGEQIARLQEERKKATR